jgi:hypothetical protein
MNTTKTLLGTTAIVVALALVLAPAALSENVFASHNDAEQGIAQGQASEQNAQCVSGTFTALSCNNLGFQFQDNEGNNALAQQ